MEKNVPGVTIFMHVNFVRGDKKRCLLMRSIVKSATTSSSAQAAPTLDDGNAQGTSDAGSFMNQNLLTGLPRNFMGLPGPTSQPNPLPFAQATGGPVNNIQNLIQQHIIQQLLQQQASNNLHGLLNNNGNLLNSFQFQGTNLSAPTMNVNAPNSTSFANMMINLPSNSGFPDAPQRQTFTSDPANYSATQSNPSASQALPTTMESSLPNANLTSSSPPRAAAAVDANGAAGTSSACGNDGTDPTVIFAMQIMRNNPSLEPRMALELARKLKGNH